MEISIVMGMWMGWIIRSSGQMRGEMYLTGPVPRVRMRSGAGINSCNVLKGPLKNTKPLSHPLRGFLTASYCEAPRLQGGASPELS